MMVLGLVLLGALWDVARGRWEPPAGNPAVPGRFAAVGVSPAQLEPPVAATDSSTAGAGPPGRSPAPLDLNHATAAQLEALPGIGPVLARRILDHRNRFGPFRSPDELRAVRGVGPRLMARLTGRVSAGS